MADFPLLSYDEVPAEAKVNLLLGNGFSRGLHEGFQYGSLKQKAEEEPSLVSDAVRRLFTTLATDDFEKILARLVEAQEVNRSHGIDCDALVASHRITREALLGAVSRTHPERSSLDPAKLESYRPALRQFERIFTTNYDLLLYWIAALAAGGEKSFEGFCDFFWGQDGSFDAGDTKHPPSCTRIYYLHGALFLSRKDDRTRKVRSQPAKSLLTLLRSSLTAAAPVFVSEGDSAAKRRSIAQSDYLEWAYGELEKLDEGITVFGHALQRQDSHIVAALCRKGGRPVAVGIYENDAKKAFAERTRIYGCFAEHDRGDDVVFFDSKTFTLARAAS